MQNFRNIAAQCLRDEAQALLDLVPQIDEQFDKVVELIYQCKGHVVVTGVGKSGHVGAKMAATFASTGTPSIFINALDALHGDLGMIMQEDVLLLISHSGNSDELLRIIDSVEGSGIPVVSMTGSGESIIARHSQFHILVGVKKEACPLNLAPTSSTTATLAMGDALAIALMEKRKFKANDFAKYHPGGSLGHQLVTRVRDVMYTENFPVIPPDMRLIDAIIDISRGKLGLGVVMRDGELLGIITDGDIRRAVEGQKQNFQNVVVGEVMTRHPKTIAPDAKLTQVKYMFNKYKIHSLLVLDKEKKLVGIVDYFATMS